MIKYRVKVTEEILDFFTEENSLRYQGTVKEGEELICSWNGSDFVWFFVSGRFVLRTKSGDHYYWDRTFTEFLKQYYPEALL